MKILIIEDEALARQRLRMMLEQTDKSIEILAELDSVASALEWLEANDHPELAFFDIQLGDGLSFQIFEKTDIDFPVVFTTAYDEYSIKAFKVNSIDYLLKPYSLDELKFAIHKYKKHHTSLGNSQQNQFILELLENNRADKYRKRIMIRIGDKLLTLDTANLNYVYSLQKATYACMDNGKEYLLDDSLDTLESQLNPEYFFRINRQYITHIQSVKDIVAWTNSRLKINLHNCQDNSIFVSRNKANAFKNWLNK